MIYVINTRVKKLEQKPDNKGPWYVLFEDSYEFMCMGNEKPLMEIGQKVEIKIRPVP